MDISAQTLIEKMEEELMQLAEQAEDDNEMKVKDHARVLKAYCEVLLSSGGGKQASVPAERTRQLNTHMQAPAYEAPVKAVKEPKKNEIPSTSGNLLDF
ncbi:YwdI family protein [Alteribacillus sp. HJP-4]|uniref:YwdI family protein n=1 Tax=Alteribacillus sp. HJP-4 TaxID=2775394 RepID=UPI0035CCFBE5